MDEHEELVILRNAVISLHESIIFFKQGNTRLLLELLGDYSYAYTNSNAGDDPKIKIDEALKKLEKWYLAK
jgi:hypothetical protein